MAKRGRGLDNLHHYLNAHMHKASQESTEEAARRKRAKGEGTGDGDAQQEDNGGTKKAAKHKK